MKFYRVILGLLVLADGMTSGLIAFGQVNPDAPSDHTMFDGIIMEEEDDPAAAELKEMLDLWMEKPLCVNSEEVAALADQKLITLYQYNKLKEYRMMYGDLLTLFELKNIDGWNLDLARKVAPYLTTAPSPDPYYLSEPGNNRIRHQLVMKTAFAAQKRKGYSEIPSGDSLSESYYCGPAYRFGLRYDMEWGRKLEAGIRIEKDPGEPWLVNNEFLQTEYSGLDHLSGYLRFNTRGLIRTVILGDYRLTFGYGLNYGGSSMMAGNGQGLTYPSHRLRANTSMSESGFLRGIAAYLSKGRTSLTLFYSYLKLDGTSLQTDTLGRRLSFSSVDYSGMHRSVNELAQRKQITENLFGGHVIFTNNWLKLGLISYYQELDVAVKPKAEAYSQFRFAGRTNLVSGLTMAVWLRKIRFASEISRSKNGGFGLVSGIEFIPVDGISIDLAYRYFSHDYQNLHGAGFQGGSNDDNEEGIRWHIRMETASRWLINLTADVCSNRWVTYQLPSPSRQWSAILSTERAWRDMGGLYFSARYKKLTSKPSGEFSHILHPGYDEQVGLKLEGRYAVMKRFEFKTRVAMNYFREHPLPGSAGWLLFQDIGYTAIRWPVRIWMRICFFESETFETRLYAYENDVLFDFSSFMHDGKGTRAIFMIKYNPWPRLDIWFRIASVNYRDRPVISSGWDEIEGDRLEELEFQFRLKI
jgi:opacity protein-like surface antigen